ncbi:interleukin-5 receptor subunit alpha-like isoform X2 [Triplophysa rosa]|uniref:Interleukin-5 receptor subunit alpha-like n=1 Tax=Triplophysa rosa TaxID=992332 RepID=A0A9W7X5D8_TRIRA|nr:interleukin-5 receptor subunit alpha-like isoform X2 [Triplophysa rosa]KAI7814328.1 putative interleukin-5 receptor subunit alpha-like [Triplophysa rosa]
MICKERLPRVARFPFILVLILTPSFTFANDTVNFTCIMNMKNHLRCFWSITNLNKNAVYSADITCQNSHQILSCSQIVEKDAVECNGHVTQEDFILKVNISLPTLSYRIRKTFHTGDIVKPEPPDNIMISNNLTKLEINWTHSEENRFSENPICYKYELKINDEVVTLPDVQSSYIKQDVDVTRTYAIQVRVKQTMACGNSIYWSDWSSVRKVGPFENKYRVNPWAITVIALVLPMLLLAVLLLCKCQRLPKKLFPPIPGPSVNVQNLLDKDNYIQDLSSRCVHHDTEVVHTVEERNA